MTNEKALRNTVEYIEHVLNNHALPEDVANEMQQGLIHAYVALNTQVRADRAAKREYWARINSAQNAAPVMA